MITSLKIEIFLAKYLANRNVSYLELFIYEYYKNNLESNEVICRLKQNEKFFTLATQISYHLLELLFSTISELVNKTENVLSLRNFLTSGIGGKMINLLSDLHMCNVTNERELVNVLTKVFPNDYWEGASELSMSRLSSLSHDDVRNIFSRDFRLLKLGSLTCPLNGSCENAHEISLDDDIEMDDISEYLNDNDFKAYNDSFCISAVELAERIIKIFSKLLEAKKESATIDSSYLTINCLNFCLDTLIRLHDNCIFNEDDQTVIKIKLTQLICQCFNSLVQRDGNEMKTHIRRIYSILESSLYEKEITYGLIMCIITTLGNLSIRKSPQRNENLEMLKLCNHLVLKQIEMLSESDNDFLFMIQKSLLEIMTVLGEKTLNVRGKRKLKNSYHRHHHSQMEACVFERILIDSFVFVRCFKQLKLILNHLKAKGICCCNGNYQTIATFMRSSTIASHFLNFIEDRIVCVMFEKSKICIYCNEKIHAEEFSNNYFALLKSEIKRRQGYELYALLNHLGNIQKLMTKEFKKEFIFNVLVPVFEEEKKKYLNDVDNNQESRLIACNCLKIITENSNDGDILERFLTQNRIDQLRDCSLIPAISLHACIILSNGLKVLDNQELITQIKSIFFANIHYLIKELAAIYDQIEMPKCDIESANESVDFEILDQQMVVVKENLSNLDILLLNSIHWDILSELIVKYISFQSEFTSNVNYHKEVLFKIACNALNTLLLKREEQQSSLPSCKKNCNHLKEMDLSKQLDIYCLVNHPNSIICTSPDLNYEQLIRQSFDLFEICQKFSDKLRSEADGMGCCLIYRWRGTDKERFINIAVHRDNFLPDSLSSDEFKPSSMRESSYQYQQHWINNFRVGTAFFDSSRSIRDAFVRVLNRLIKPDEEMKAMHQKNLINEITGKFGIKYLSGIARNCFDISFRLSSQNFGPKMSTALDELKLLLLQANDWNSDSENSKKVIVDALQLLLGVAEMKTRGVNRLMFLNSENHIECTTESIFSELNASSEGGNMLSCDGSDEDMCDKKTEAYFTADENYDADEEYFSLRGDDTICSQSFKTPSNCSTFLDVKISNEHICRLVVEILMDVSKICIESEENLDALIPLAQRLACMKSYLGGSEFLLKGFSPILTKNLPFYHAFQHAVLELIDEINTPEILKTFFAILSEENAPAELIIPRIEALCNKDHTSKPFCAVKYPIVSSELIVSSSCDTYVHGLIQSLKNINRSRSPFVEASQIIPLNFFELKLWTSNVGYTLSTWIELEYCENPSKIHLISIGSEKMILAIFINSDGTFDFVAIKPSYNSTHYHHKSKIKVSKSLDLKPNTTSSSASDQQNSDKENVNKSNILGIASAILRDRELPSNIRTRGSLKNGNKKSSKNEENYKQMETTRVLVKSKKSKLKYHHWTHVCLALRSNETQISILLTLNGTEHENIEIPIDGMQNGSGKSDMNGEFQLFFVGASKPEQTSENINEMSYCMSNITLFKTAFEASLVAYLFALGPNCSNFSDCEIKNIIPIRGSLDLTKLITRVSLRTSSIELLRTLKSSVLLTYAIGKSNYATGYLKSDYGKPLEIFTNGFAPIAHSLKSIARAVYFTGGLSSLLFLFARTVELTRDSVTQSTALFIFLKMAFSNNYLYAEFEQKKLFNLVAHVFKNENCYRGPGMLKAVLDVIFNGTMFNKKSHADEYQINERSELNIQNPSLLMTLLSNFNIFQLPDRADASNLNLLFRSLKVATRKTHPFKHINRQCLIEHGFYERILDFCKIHLTSNSNAMTLPTTTAITLVDLLKMLSKNPPIYVTTKIQELLILLHHPSESFITHDRSKFNFILSSQKPTKVNRNSTSKFSFNFSTKIRSTNSIPVPQSPTSSQRSNSTDSCSPKTPPFLIHSDLVFGETDGGTLKSFKGSTDSAATSSTNTSRKIIKSQKFDELSDNQAKKVTKAFVDLKSKKGIKTPTKMFSKRLQSTPKKSPFKHATPSKKKIIETEGSGDGEDEFDIKLIETFDTLMSKSSFSTSENNLNRYETGISVLQEHLFIMLKEALLSVDDNQIQMEVAECIRIESLIMFANHPDGNVRAAIIELIYTIVIRQSQEMINFYQKSNYWIHLGNQLSIASANKRIIQTCINWIFINEKEIDFDEIIKLRKDDIKFKAALRILIALIPSTTNDSKLMKSLLKFLRLLMETNDDYFITMVDYGLVTACLRTLMKVDDDDMIESLQVILEEIATKSFTTSNAINGLWELLYGLVFAERQGMSPNSIRDIHLTILRQLFSLSLAEQNRRGSRGNESFQLSMVIKKTLGNLPSSEIKTRFNMIHDRALQFLYSWEKFDDLKTFEIDFVKYLIDLYFCGIHQGSALLLWALNPTCCEEIQLFVTHKIIASLTIDSNFSVSEPKMLKALLHHLFTSSSQFFSEDQQRIIIKFCGSTLNQQQQNFNWVATATEKIEIMNQNAQKEQYQQVDKIIFKHETLVHAVIDGAMRITRDVIDIQNRERRQLMNYLKRTQEIDYYREWHEVIQRMTHEETPWYNAELYPTTFELDETEGPGRVRIRMKRTALKIDDKFFMNEFKHKAKYQYKKQLLDYLLNPKETERYSINDQIVFTFNGKHLTLEQEIEGEIIVTDNQFNFLANLNTYNNSIICDINDIDEIWDRRYQHKEIAIEIFLKCSKNFFFIFETKYERDIVTKFLTDKTNMKEGSQRVESITQRWIESKMTNYEYLTELNKISGRSYNDLMQYPVFPWILTDYSSDVLDLTIAESYRKLRKTISTQYEENEEHYITNYNYLMQQSSDYQSILKPYHYSSHYSNSGTVLHFLVRMPPFTNMFLLYQDHNFDIPDRTFHSLATTYRLTSRESATDVKELIPEFFHLPDFLINNEGFNYGIRQSGEQVNDVKLPTWCDESARLFTFIHRQALESDFVRKQLHQWIDLIFGFKQKGKAAVEAVNVFHPATYPEFQITNITDQVEKSAYETMVRTYGQMPKQIFISPHKKSTSNEKQDLHYVLRGVKGLKWGVFTGSPQLQKPRKLSAKSPIPCKQKNPRLVGVNHRNKFFVIPNTSCLMKGTAKNSYDLVLWKENDGVVRTKSFHENKSRKLFNVPSCDPITACGADVNYSNLWFGHQSGIISVYKRIDERNKIKKRTGSNQKVLSTALESIIDIKVNEKSLNSMDDELEVVQFHWNYPITLLRHSIEVTTIKVCAEFKIVVSIGGDGRAVIWDSQKVEYIRSIEPSCNTLKACLTHVDISSTLGDILTVFRPRNESTEDDCFEVIEDKSDDFINISMSMAGKSQLRLHNINAKYIAHTFIEGVVNATCFSFIKEGSGINVIAIALNDGTVKLYSTWNLDFVREIATGCNRIIEISFSTNHYLTILSDQEIHVWGSEGIIAERPSFHDIILE